MRPSLHSFERSLFLRSSLSSFSFLVGHPWDTYNRAMARKSAHLMLSPVHESVDQYKHVVSATKKRKEIGERERGWLSDAN